MKRLFDLGVDYGMGRKPAGEQITIKEDYYTPSQIAKNKEREARAMKLLEDSGLKVAPVPEDVYGIQRDRFDELLGSTGAPESLAAMKDAIDRLQDTPMQRDYRGAVAFLDSLQGTNVAQGLKDVETPQEREAMLAKLNSMLGKQQGDQVGDFTQFAKVNQLEQSGVPSGVLPFLKPDAPAGTRQITTGDKNAGKGDPSKLIKDKAYLDLRSAREFKDKLTEYKKLFEESIQSGLGPRHSKYKGRLESLGVDVRGKYRQDSGWGAPQAAEFKEASRLIDEISSWSPIAYAKFLAGGGTDAFISKLDSLDQGIDTNVGKLVEDLRIGYPGLENEIQRAYGTVGETYKIQKKDTGKGSKNKKSGGLTPEEQAELEALEKELGGSK